MKVVLYDNAYRGLDVGNAGEYPLYTGGVNRRIVKKAYEEGARPSDIEYIGNLDSKVKEALFILNWVQYTPEEKKRIFQPFPGLGVNYVFEETWFDWLIVKFPFILERVSRERARIKVMLLRSLKIGTVPSTLPVSTLHWEERRETINEDVFRIFNILYAYSCEYLEERRREGEEREKEVKVEKSIFENLNYGWYFKNIYKFVSDSKLKPESKVKLFGELALGVEVQEGSEEDRIRGEFLKRLIQRVGNGERRELCL